MGGKLLTLVILQGSEKHYIKLEVTYMCYAGNNV